MTPILKGETSSMSETSKLDAFRMEAHPFFWFGQILTLRNRVLNRQLREFGLDYQRMKVIATLAEHPGCSMQRLADLTAVDRTSLTHTVHLLVGSSLVDRQPAPGDRRSAVLKLTAAGRRMTRKILPLILRLNEQTLAGFSPKEADDLLVHLRRMTENLRD